MSGQPWVWPGVLQGQIYSLQCSAAVVERALRAAAGLGRWFVEKAAVGSHSAQSPASGSVASSGHALGHCNPYKEKHCLSCTAASAAAAAGADKEGGTLAEKLVSLLLPE